MDELVADHHSIASNPFARGTGEVLEYGFHNCLEEGLGIGYWSDEREWTAKAAYFWVRRHF